MIPGTEQSVDVRIYEPLMEMLDAMREQGLAPIICSGYRTLDKQEKLFNRKVQSYVRRGHTKEESYALARQTISIPGSGSIAWVWLWISIRRNIISLRKHLRIRRKESG